jgi:hypothetical protein
MGMKLVKKTADYSIYRRGDDRYAVKDAQKQPVNGDDKTAILLAEGLITAPAPKAPEPEEEPAEAAAEEGAGEEAEAAGGEEAES